MADLYKLGLSPNSTGFTSEDSAAAAIVTLLDGGAPRVRADQLGVYKVCNVTWSVGPQDYDYLCAFYRQGTAYGSQPFLINLALDSSEISTCTAFVVPKTWKLNSQQGLTWVVQAQLYVSPLIVNSNDDQQLLALYS